MHHPKRLTRKPYHPRSETCFTTNIKPIFCSHALTQIKQVFRKAPGPVGFLAKCKGFRLTKYRNAESIPDFSKVSAIRVRNKRFLA
jgi:hypothetical protein